VAEVLTIKKLGPLKEARIEPRPLTVIIGPQASGKSLIAQCLYFFRGLRQHVARRYKSSWQDDAYWYNTALKEVLDDIRGVAFGYFAEGTASLTYHDSDDKQAIGLKVYSSNRKVSANQSLKNRMNKWIGDWKNDIRSIETSWFKSPNLYIPTERSIFTRLVEEKTGMLFDPVHPEPFRAFAQELFQAQNLYRAFFQKKSSYELRKDIRDANKYILKCQQLALSGEAYVPPVGRQEWKWRISEPQEDGIASTRRGVVPIQATASGQTEAWPFFVIAATYGVMTKNGTFYFEEPETHLHPAAQLQVANVIAFLVNRGHHFTITTHSPFFLYVINNFILRHLVNENNVPENVARINPNDVAVYSLKNGICRDIMDREDTKLIPSTELDDIANQLGAEFDQLLDQLDHD
jgi:predicted ATPase